MIKPFTILCLLLAAGSGLYLYQAKQRTLQLDRQIDAVLRETEQVRAKTAMLRADYADLSRPDRLLALSQRYLALRPTEPGQFVELSALAHALPPVGKLSAPVNPDSIVPLLGAPPANAPAPTEAPAPGATTLVSLSTRQPGGNDGAPAHPAAAPPTRHADKPAPTRLAEKPPTRPDAHARGPTWTHTPAPAAHPTRLAEAMPQHLVAAPAPARRMPVAPRPAPPPANGGSMLGDAGAMAMPPPVPVAN